jgi:uncharacterized protein YegL
MKYFFLIIVNLLLLSKSIDISISHGERVFNPNVPIILNLKSQDTNTQISNVDLICVIDISGSMQGEKIILVKESLKKLVSLMSDNDRISLILFNHQSFNILDLTYTNSGNKIMIFNKIDSIKAGGGTVILSGLQSAIDILKTDQSNMNNRISSIILLSDGNDNNLDEFQLAQNFKDMTKDLKLFFTLHTFGYGNDHDPKIMNKLANIRDGSFYYVSEFKKVQDYFINVLGGCMSVFSNYVLINVNSYFDLKKVYGEEELYNYNLNDRHFKTELLQFISGKDYTFVLEIDLPHSIKKGDKILDVEIKYIDMNGKEIVKTKSLNYESKLEVVDLDKVNEEYARSMTYETMKNALKFREENNISKAKSLLTRMREWLYHNYKGKETYEYEIRNSLKLIEDEQKFNAEGRAAMYGDVREGQRKMGGSKLSYSNAFQKSLINKIA